MAIEIIKPGNAERNHTYYGRCSKCGCVFKCDSVDVQHGDQRDPGSCVTCPTPRCGNLVYVDTKKITTTNRRSNSQSNSRL